MLKRKFNHGKKPLYTALDKSNNIRVWLKDVANDIMEDNSGRYVMAKEACAKHTKTEITHYEIGAKQVLFPLPTNLSIQEVAQELENNAIEIIMEDEDEKNPFYGCRLKLKPLLTFFSCNYPVPLPLMPLTFTINTSVEVPQLRGFKIELDASPAPVSKCRIS